MTGDEGSGPIRTVIASPASIDDTVSTDGPNRRHRRLAPRLARYNGPVARLREGGGLGCEDVFGWCAEADAAPTPLLSSRGREKRLIETPA